MITRGRAEDEEWRAKKYISSAKSKKKWKEREKKWKEKWNLSYWHEKRKTREGKRWPRGRKKLEKKQN